MAFNITSRRTQDGIFVPAKKVEVTDATATTTTQGDMGAALYKHFRAQVYATTYTQPDGNTVTSVDTVFVLEASNSSNFDAANADVFCLDTFVLPKVGGTASSKLSFVLEGEVPVLDLMRYARVKAALGTNGAINFDAVIEGA